MAVVIELNVSSITEESVARRLLAILVAIEGFDPQRYEMNQNGNWRGWDVDRAVVDLLTQRTQFFRVDGVGGTAVVATGKHDEVPTVAISGAAVEAFDESMLDGLPVRDVRIIRSDDE